jgi:long-subunit acyl-CoA synthetase (AMP-forming)
LWSICCGPTFIGYESVFIKDRTPETILSTARRFRITILCAVPLLANNLSVGLNKKVAQQGRKETRGVQVCARVEPLFAVHRAHLRHGLCAQRAV